MKTTLIITSALLFSNFTLFAQVVFTIVFFASSNY